MSDGQARWSAEDMWARHTMLVRSAATLVALQARVGVMSRFPDWSGAAADAAADSLRRSAIDIGDCVDVLTAIGLIVGRAGDDRSALDGWDRDSSTGAIDGLDRHVAAALDSLNAEGRAADDPVPLPHPTVSALLDAGNRRRVADHRRHLRAVEAALTKELRGTRWGGLFSNADAGLEQTRARLADLDALEAVLARPGRRLMDFDPGDVLTRAAVSVGDVDRATRFAVFVPGAGSTVRASLGGYDRDVAAVVTAASAGSDDAVAGVVWMGYEAPQWNTELVDPDRSVMGTAVAEAGAADLAAALDAVAAPDHRVTLVGHSYGTVVAAAALGHGARPDDVVLMGSPGWSVGTETTPIYVLEAATDPVADLGWFDTDPSELFGTTQLSAQGSVGHGRYLEPGSTSANNVAAVVAGTPPVPARRVVDVADALRILARVLF